MRGWKVAALLAVMLALGGVEHHRQGELTARYAAALAACLNGNDFVVRGRIAHCIVTDVAVFKGE